MEEARVAQARARRNRAITVGAGLVAAVLILFAIVAIVSNKDDSTTVDATGSPTTIATDGSTAPGTTAPGTTAAGATPVSVPAPAAGAKISGDTPCPPADGSAERTTSFAKAPPTCIDPAKTYTATITTSEGDIVLSLDAKQSPIAVNNFVVLARYHFFEGIPFHRIVPGFVDQTGDPEATGGGGPGYDLPDEEPTRAYAAGDVAMARGEKVSGSQFFFTIDPAPLNNTVQSKQPAYPILGTATSGQDIVQKINAFGSDDGGTGAPTKVVTITKVSITET